MPKCQCRITMTGPPTVELVADQETIGCASVSKPAQSLGWAELLQELTCARPPGLCGCGGTTVAEVWPKKHVCNTTCEAPTRQAWAHEQCQAPRPCRQNGRNGQNHQKAVDPGWLTVSVTDGKSCHILAASVMESLLKVNKLS